MHESRRKTLVKRFAEDNPPIPRATYHELVFLWEQRLCPKVIELCIHNVQLFPDDPTLHYHLGVHLHSTEYFKDAYNHFKTAKLYFKHKPSESIPLFRIYYRMGLTLHDLKHNEKALKYIYKSEKRMTPHEYNSDIYFTKACIFNDMKRHHDEIEAYERAIELEPDQAIYHRNKADTQIILKQFREAMETLETAIGLNLSTNDIRFLRGYAAFRAGDYSIAEEEYENVAAYVSHTALTTSRKSEFLDGMRRSEPPTKKQKRVR